MESEGKDSKRQEKVRVMARHDFFLCVPLLTHIRTKKMLLLPPSLPLCASATSHPFNHHHHPPILSQNSIRACVPPAGALE